MPVLPVLPIEIVTSLRRGDLGLDIVAALSISAALAVGENLAAAGWEEAGLDLVALGESARPRPVDGAREQGSAWR